MNTPQKPATKLASPPSLCCIALLIFLQCLVTGCSGDSRSKMNSSDIAISPTQPPATNVAVPDNRFSNSYSILIFGNSHTAGIGDLISQLITAEDPNTQVQIDSFGGGFLDDPSSNPGRLDRLQNQQWSHIILQGQKYSQSGTTTYPTTATENWIRLAKAQSTTPILFPEHPQRNDPHEGQRVHNLHTSISAVQAACIAPVGLAWDRVIALRPDLRLHHLDGNHASRIGKLLTAMVFYEVITGYRADLLPYNPALELSPEIQSFFGQIASETIAQHSPCAF